MKSAEYSLIDPRNVSPPQETGPGQAIARAKARMAGKKALVVGAGKSGTEAIRLLAGLGVESLSISDSRPEMPQARESLSSLNVRWHLGPQQADSFLGYDLVVISPGVPIDHPGLVKARESGTEIIGEIELAYRAQALPILAVTGSNGKTSTVSLTGHILSALGRKPFLGGNIGTPFSLAPLAYLESQKGRAGERGGEAAKDLSGDLSNYPAFEAGPWDSAVLEISSFQLESVRYFRPKAAAFLNLTPDHLDRHGSMAEYFRAKGRIFSQMGQGDLAVINADDALVSHKCPPARRFLFSRKKEGDPRFRRARRTLANLGEIGDFGAYVAKAGRSEVIRILEDGMVTAEAPWSDFKLYGTHNQENLMAAVGLAMSLGLSPGEALAAGASFQPGDHRLTKVAERDGVSWFDDSKATNTGAVMAALESLDGPCILIMGGQDKGLDFRPLRALIKEKASHAVLIGQAQAKLAQALRGAVRIILAESMAEAVEICHGLAKPGCQVLLSPACASFDMYGSYKERGEDFARNVLRRLEKGD
jgi:UDP-N-acetylmuramoylalanine--D-glutamate ligase